MIMGYHDGELSFIEPMVHEDILKAREGFELAVPRPEKLGRSTLWPDRFIGRYDAEDGRYRFILTDFAPIE